MFNVGQHLCADMQYGSCSQALAIYFGIVSMSFSPRLHDVCTRRAAFKP